MTLHLTFLDSFQVAFRHKLTSDDKLELLPFLFNCLFTDSYTVHGFVTNLNTFDTFYQLACPFFQKSVTESILM